MNSPSGRDALLDTAERLVAERGLHGVSVREVIRTAGQRHNGAVAYHFGSWDGLLATIWATRSAEQSLQENLIDEAAASGPERLDGLIRAYVHPFVTEVAANEPSYWAQFNEQWLTGMRLNFVDHPASDDSAQPPVTGLQSLSQLYALIAAELTQLRPEARAPRVAVAARFVVSGMAAWERDSLAGAAASLYEQEREMTTLMLALLRAPG